MLLVELRARTSGYEDRQYNNNNCEVRPQVTLFDAPEGVHGIYLTPLPVVPPPLFGNDLSPTNLEWEHDCC